MNAMREPQSFVAFISSPLSTLNGHDFVMLQSISQCFFNNRSTFPKQVETVCARRSKAGSIQGMYEIFRS